MPDWAVALALATAAILVALAGWLILRERARSRARVAGEALATQALAEGRRAAEARLERQSLFVAKLSHELRGPLHGLSGMLELLADAPLPATEAGHVRAARECAESMRAILTDVLDLSKMDLGRMELSEIPFDLAHLIDQVLNSVRAEAQARGVTLTRQVELEVPYSLEGDPEKLRQVLANLVQNAVQFTTQGSVTVAVALLERNMERTDDRIRLRIEVRDTGIGVAPADLDDLFQPFSQAGRGGLGLAICRELVRVMGGEIGVQSQPGVGSKFWFTLPLRPSVAFLGAPSSPEAASAESTAPAARTRSVPARILVAEDNPVSQEVVARALTKLGHEVDAVGDGRAALERLHERLATAPYDLLLLDCQLPELDGYQVTAEIRRSPHPRINGIPIIAMTASAIKGDRERCLEVGMDDYVSKPMDLRRFGAVVGRWLATDSTLPDGAPPGAWEPMSSAPLDLQAIARLRALDQPGRPSMVERALERFTVSVPTRIAAMREATAAGDAFRLRREAHTLKSSFGFLGAHRAASLAARAEALVEAGRLHAAGDLVPKIETEFHHALAALEELVAPVPSASTGLPVFPISAAARKRSRDPRPSAG